MIAQGSSSRSPIMTSEARDVGGAGASQHAVPAIRGSSVYLRPWERADLPLRARWLADGEILAGLAEGSAVGLAGSERWFDEVCQAQQGRDAYRFVIVRLADDLPIGSIWIGPIEWTHGAVEFGVYLGERSAWGHGLGTDALDAIVDFAFGWLRMERVWLRVRATNRRARRSYEKAGFREEGIERSALLIEGEREDVIRMSLLRPEWEALDRPRSWQRGAG